MALFPASGGDSWTDITSNISFNNSVVSDYSNFKLYKNNLGMMFAKGDLKVTISQGENRLDSSISGLSNNDKGVFSVYRGDTGFMATAQISSSGFWVNTNSAVSSKVIQF